jgi:Protein of unknown function (DUF3618)
MAHQSEQLEWEAEQTRNQLARSLDELRFRVTPGQLIVQLTDYACEGAAAGFLRNLARKIRENPIPVLLIAVGIGWLVIASARSPRAMPGFDKDVRPAPLDEIGAPVAARIEASPEKRGETVPPVDA